MLMCDSEMVIFSLENKHKDKSFTSQILSSTTVNLVWHEALKKGHIYGACSTKIGLKH